MVQISFSYVCTVESDSLKMKQFVFSDFFPLNQPKTLVFQWVVGWFCLLCMRTDERACRVCVCGGGAGANLKSYC